jgi:PEGA domain
VSQSPNVDQTPSSECDPLLEFSAEPDSPSAHVPPSEPENTVELVENAANEAMPRAAPVPPPDDSELRGRVDRAERLLEKSLIEISTLKSDLATLVGAFDDIKKRQSRRVEPIPLPVKPPARWGRAAGVAAAVAVLIAASVAMWGLTAASYGFAEPPPIETVSAAPIEQPVAVEPPALAPAEPQPAIVAASSAASDVPARVAEAPARKSTRLPTEYVGTLTVDANPGGDVFVNRRNVGPTPVRLEKLRAGSHLIWIERDGYRRWTRVVPVAADRISRVTATLDPVKP